MGDIDSDKEEAIQEQKSPYLTKMDQKYITRKHEDEKRATREENKERCRMLRDRGLIMYKELVGDQFMN